jgi:protein tyrosine phosphatase (PTP) superfamily phosphohydrolase (DUF442 family)
LKGTGLAAVLVALSALSAAAQAPSPDLAASQKEAARILSAGPRPGVRGRRLTPDADSLAEPAEALGNFRKVAEGFYRSAQPSKAGYAKLRDLGFKTILTLKSNGDQERRDAAAYGLSVENVPMSGFSAPTYAQMDRALAVVATAPRPLLVHCQFGKDRTGFVVASYRVAVEKAPIETAVQEAYDAGCCFIPFGSLSKFLAGYGRHRRALRRPRRQ